MSTGGGAASIPCVGGTGGAPLPGRPTAGCLEQTPRSLGSRLTRLLHLQNDPTVKIPWVRRDLSGNRVLVMEWIDGIRCTDPEARSSGQGGPHRFPPGLLTCPDHWEPKAQAIRTSGVSVEEFIRCGVVSGLRQLLEASDCRPTLPFAFPSGLLTRFPPLPPLPAARTGRQLTSTAFFFSSGPAWHVV